MTPSGLPDLRELEAWAVQEAAQAFYDRHPLEMLNSHLPDGTDQFAWKVMTLLIRNTLDKVPGFRILPRLLKEYMISVLYACFILGYKAGKGIEDVSTQPIGNDA